MTATRGLEMCEWQPIETAPKDGTEFQVWFSEQGHDGGVWHPYARINGKSGHTPDPEGVVMLGYENPHWDGCNWIWEWQHHKDKLDSRFVPTHWMPLPSSPK